MQDKNSDNENQNSSGVTAESPRPAQEQCLAMHELIYCEDGDDYNANIAAIKAQWPQAVFEDGSDYIHEHRFAVTIPEVTQDDFFCFALKNRFAMSCLGFRLATLDDAPHILALWKSLNKPERDAETTT